MLDEKQTVGGRDAAIEPPGKGSWRVCVRPDSRPVAEPLSAISTTDCGLGSPSQNPALALVNVTAGYSSGYGEVT